MTGYFGPIEQQKFNARYILSVAAHRVKIGIDWLDPDTMNDPGIRRFMDKVTWEARATPSPRIPGSLMSRVEVTARGQNFVVEKDDLHGRSGTEFAMTQDELAAKFRHNAKRVLPKGKIDKAIEYFTKLEDVKNIEQVMREVTI